MRFSFLDWKAANRHTPATIKAYCSRLLWFYRFLAQQQLQVIDRLYGKLAAASPLTDAELRSAFASALERLIQQEMLQGR